jgi:hypothetical protein
MRRRDFITFLGSTAATWPLRARNSRKNCIASFGFRRPTRSIFWMAGNARADAILVFPESATMVHRTRIAQFAVEKRLPSMFGWSEYCDAGGLLSMGQTSVQPISGLRPMPTGSCAAKTRLILPLSSQQNLNWW